MDQAITEADVWAEYDRLGYRETGDMGWVFAMTPVAHIDTAEVVIVGLNPGGKGGEGVWEFAEGNAYLDDRWDADHPDALFPIQVEVGEWMKLLAVEGPQVFAGQYIPFRSPSLAQLPRLEEAIAFADRLWSGVVARSPAKLYVCMGQRAAWHIAHLIGAVKEDRLPTGWGSTVAIRYVAPDGRVVVSIPHPSRYLLLGPGRSPEKRRAAKLAILQAARPADATERS